MLKLRLGAPDEEWIELFDDLKVRLKEYSTGDELAARGASLDMEDLLERQETGRKLTPTELAVQGHRFLIELAARTIVDWSGVGSDLDEDPLPCTPDNVRLAMEQSVDFYGSFEREWGKRAKARVLEKKVSGNGPNGTVDAGLGTATTAANGASPVPQTATGRTDFVPTENMSRQPN